MSSNTLPDERGLVILLGLGKLNRHVYGGTVSHAEKTRRRAANRQARASRRINRVAGAR